MKACVTIKLRPGEVKEGVRRLRETGHVLEANMTFAPFDAGAVIESDDLGAQFSLCQVLKRG